jgi:hypothetical protein
MNIEDAYSRECAGVDERGEGEGDPVPQLLLVAQAQLTLVVDLRPAIVILLFKKFGVFQKYFCDSSRISCG